uniref:C2H2-type domain-containing protein n=1 Tax=Oryza meridionalis TaxID=40149 RepID=A0A0E0DKI4_9ORYZ
MVEPGRARETKVTASASNSAGSDAAVMKKKKKKLVVASRKVDEKDKKQVDYKCTRSSRDECCKVESRHQCTEPESPSYRLALRSLFSCRNSSSHAGHHHHHRAADGKKLGCNSASICKVKQDNPMQQHMRRAEDELKVKDKPPVAEPYCKRRASVSACNISSERSVKKSSVKQQQQEASSSLQSSASISASSCSSTAGGGGSFRGMQQLSLRRLSGCYECHMVVDPISGVFRDSSSSMRATICSCPDCGEIFVRPDSLHLHQSIRHAVSELGAEDTSRNIISIIFQSSWLKKQSPVCAIDRILKVHNAARTLARFDDYRAAVKAKARRHPRCTADGNELLRFHCATLSCDLGLHGATHLCDLSCAACAIIRHGFRPPAPGAGIRTMATSGRAHDAVVSSGSEGDRRAMLVCRVIAGRVKREEAAATEEEEEEEEEYDSVAGTTPGLYSNLDELDVFNPTAILPCFVVVYRA